MARETQKYIDALYLAAQNQAKPEAIRTKISALAELVMNTISTDWLSIVLIDPSKKVVTDDLSYGPDPSIQDDLILAKILSRCDQTHLASEPDQDDYLNSRKRFDQLFYREDRFGQLRYSGLTELLETNGQVFGIINIARKINLYPFIEQDWRFLKTMASQICQTIYNDFLIQEEKKKSEQAATLREVARMLNSSLDLQTVLELILDQLVQVVEFDSASIMLVDLQNFEIVAHRKLRSTAQLTLEGEVIAYPHIVELLEQRAPVLINNTQKDPRWKNLIGSQYIRSWLGVPLVGKNDVIGLLNLDKEQPDFYTEDDIGLASAFANQAAIAIENARLYSSAQSQVNEMDALRETIADISTELELPKLLEAILIRAVKLLNATGGDLGLYDYNRNEIEIVVSHNMGKDYKNTRMVPGEGAMGLALATRQSVVVADYSQWNNASPSYREGRWHAVIAMPYMIGDRMVGVMGIVDKNNDRIFTKDDEHLLSLFAQHAAIAVENARLYEAAREATSRREILHQVSQQIVAAGLDEKGIYSAIHKAASQLMAVEGFVITQYNFTNKSIQDINLVDKNGQIVANKFQADQGLSGKVMRTGKPVYIEDLLEDIIQSEENQHFGNAKQVRSVLAVPMRLRGKIIGMIAVQSCLPSAYSPEDESLLELLASYAAIAIDNSRLFAHIQQLATIDPVTEIFNRRHLFDLGRLEFLRARRFKRSLSAIMMDIDHFKLVNDRYGHAMGDYVLLKLGKLLCSEIREVDVVGRYGGEEFTIILPETNQNIAYEIAERLRLKINAAFDGSDQSIPRITVSIGLSETDDTVADFAALIQRADLAMYSAKEAGRDRVEIYHPDK